MVQAKTVPQPVLAVLLQVLKLQNLSQINERCLDLQRNKSSKSRQTAAAEAPNSTGQQVVSFMQQSSKRRQRKQAGSGGSCPYLSAAGAAAWEGFSDLVIAAPIDVEELAKLGKKKQVSCRITLRLPLLREHAVNLACFCTPCLAYRHLLTSDIGFLKSLLLWCQQRCMQF